jgi:NADP-dependent 3-hydroxy acid dehydrogenase YdfG
MHNKNNMNKIARITGASSGIGEALARELISGLSLEWRAGQKN